MVATENAVFERCLPDPHTPLQAGANTGNCPPKAEVVSSNLAGSASSTQIAIRLRNECSRRRKHEPRPTHFCHATMSLVLRIVAAPSASRGGLSQRGTPCDQNRCCWLMRETGGRVRADAGCFAPLS